MLVEFRFSNFRSFKDEVVFSMEPLSQNGVNPNVINTNLKKISQLYRTSGIFGANASGKSNFLLALTNFITLIRKSASYEFEKKIYTDKYLLDETHKDMPTFFEISLLIGWNLYKYGFKYNEEKIIEEYLYASNISETGTSRENKIFHRKENIVEKSKGFLQRWIDELAPNRLFLSELINLRKCSIPAVVATYTEICQNINYMSMTSKNDIPFDMITNNTKNRIINLIQNADLGIVNITAKPLDWNSLKMSLLEDGIKITAEQEEIIQTSFLLKETEVIDLKSHHITENGALKEFDFYKIESKGTQVFLTLTQPIIQALEEGKTLFVDELDSSLHPYLVKYIIEMFNDDEINKNNAQLIFTSHAHYLMDGDHLSRDQIWFVSKETNNGFHSDLYSLSDFNIKVNRKNVSFYNAYIHGVYGGVPFMEKINASNTK